MKKLELVAVALLLLDGLPPAVLAQRLLARYPSNARCGSSTEVVA
jgi:hypothetical protein